MKKLKLSLGMLLIGCILNAQDWNTSGNSGTSPTTNYVGTSDNTDLSFGTNGSLKMQLEATGELGLGVTSPASWLHIKSTGTKESFRTDVPANEDNYWRMFAQRSREAGRNVAGRGAVKNVTKFVALGYSSFIGNKKAFRISEGFFV